MYALVLALIIGIGPFGELKRQWVQVDTFEYRVYNGIRQTPLQQCEAAAKFNSVPKTEYKCLEIT